MARTRSSGALARPEPSGLSDVIEMVLDKGIVVDAYARVSALGIELLTIDARIVVASVDTYLRFAEATNRLELDEKGTSLVDLLEEGIESGVGTVASHVGESKVDEALDKVGDTLGSPAEKLARTAGRAVLNVAETLVEKLGDDD